LRPIAALLLPKAMQESSPVQPPLEGRREAPGSVRHVLARLDPVSSRRHIDACMRLSGPLLANMVLHYAFDAWMARTFPGVLFERYCDDIIVHASS
jgi:hypothetical protein